MLQIIKLWFVGIFKEQVLAIMAKIVLMLTDSMSCGIKVDHTIWVLKSIFNQIVLPRIGKNKEKVVEVILWISKWIWIKFHNPFLKPKCLSSKEWWIAKWVIQAKGWIYITLSSIKWWWIHNNIIQWFQIIWCSI